MKKIGLFYGSSTAKTAAVAQKVKEAGIETPAVIVIGETAGLQLFDEQQEKNRKK